ncbi:MAG: PEP-CTERM sorting domain-containing protein [Verrucomicrobia bacterium]|nr:PEP-CTERM sorting domain-containing protein [Verrucomicrobiota bacterium]
MTSGTQQRIFEGQGTLSGSTDIVSGGQIIFQNLTGNYAFSNRVRPATTGVNVTSSAGSNNVTFTSGLRIGGGGTTIRNDSSGILNVGTLFRNDGNPTYTITGSGITRMNEVGILGGDPSISLIKSESGLLEITGNTIARAAGNFTLNAGTVHAQGGAPLVGSNFIWNEGTVRFELEDDTAWTIGAGLNKGTGSTFAFDFSGFNAGTMGSWTLANFTSTNFNASDFTATGITYDSGLSGQFVVSADSLHFSVIPEPGTLALVAIALGSLLFFRRRK